MNRFAIATLVVSLANLAHADAPPAPPPVQATQPAPTKPAHSRPDEVADVEAREANLERDEPRDGLTFSAALGPSIALGAGSVGRGPQLSLRLGHVATRRTVIMFEFGVAGSLHKQSVDGPTLTDNDFSLFVGAQTYQKKKLWVRGAGGLTTLVKNQMANGSGGDKPRTGIGGVVGAGLDIYRNGYFVFGAEATSLASISGDGFKMHLALQLNVSYY